MHQEISKLNLQNFKESIQEYSLLYQKINAALIYQNLERIKSMKFGSESDVYWWKY